MLHLLTSHTCPTREELSLPIVNQLYTEIMDGITAHIGIISISKTMLTNGKTNGFLTTVELTMPIIHFMADKPVYKPKPFNYDINSAKQNAISTAYYYRADSMQAGREYLFLRDAPMSYWFDQKAKAYAEHDKKENLKAFQYENVLHCKHGYYFANSYTMETFKFDFKDTYELRMLIQNSATRYSKQHTT